MGYWRKFHNATGIRHLEILLHWTLSCLLASLFRCLVLTAPLWIHANLSVRLSVVQSQLPSVVSSRNCLLLLASLLSSHQLSLSGLQPPTASLGLLPPTASAPVQLPTASLWVASSTLVRVPLPLPDTARFQVQESFVWFRAKTDSSALAAYPHSATYHPLLPLSFILNKLQHDSQQVEKQEHLQEVKTELTKF